MKCPDCGEELMKTPNSKHWKHAGQWYDCDKCERTWRIWRSEHLYQKEKLRGEQTNLEEEL